MFKKIRIAQRASLVAFALLLLLLGSPVTAQEGTLFVEGDKVGIGIDLPAATLHQNKSDGTAQLKVEESSPTTAARTLFTLSNNGGIRFAMQTSQGSSQNSVWQFSALANFVIDFNKNIGPELRLFQDGDLEIGGILMEGSSRTIKAGFQEVESIEILARLAELPITTWSYRTDQQGVRHLGPMAEDFHAAFGLGLDPQHISPSDKAGVALVSIQALHDLLEQEATRIQELEKEKLELRKRLARIEAVLDID